MAIVRNIKQTENVEVILMTEIFKRMFSAKKPKSVSKSIRVPEKMWEALELLADQQGETPNGYIVLVLDQFLQIQLEKGILVLPKTEDLKASGL
jgi:hypothetical protein